MNYEKLHKDTINKLQQMVNSGKITVETARGICADFVPESEDEVMIKFIKNQLFNIKKTITENYELDAKLTKAIDWLEKQGEKKSIDDLTQQEAMDIAVAKCFEQCEQKPAYNVKPKFEIGDLITNGILVGKIDEIHEFGYHAYFGDHYADVPNAEYWHKWTIQDAKDGDVLACESGWTCIFKTLVNDETFSSYCFMDKTKWFCETGSECHTLKEEFVKAYNGKIYPATKGQRDLLFQKMKEAGYEWDAEKKELKRIEQRHSWSEEDEKRISSILLSIEYCKEQYPYLREYQYDIDWSKSLKERYTWKPSDEQMDALRYVTNFDYGGHKATLVSLYEQLKELKG